MDEAYRNMTVAERGAILWRLCEFAHGLAMADVRRRYPEATERECLLRVASRTIPRELMIASVGWDPLEKGY